MSIIFGISWLIVGLMIASALALLFHRTEATDSPYRAFAVLTLLVAVDLAALTEYYTLHTLNELYLVYSFRFVLSCFIFTVAIWFVSRYTRLRSTAYWVAGFGVVFAFFAMTYLVSNGHLFYARVGLDEVQGPFHHSLTTMKGVEAGVLLPYFLAAVYSIFPWAFWRCAAMWRKGLWYKALALSAYLTLQLGTGLYDQFLHPAIMTEQFAFFGMVLIMGAFMALEVRHTSEKFYYTLNALVEETTKRERYEKRARYLANHDALTGLSNRRLMLAAVGRTIEQFPSLHELGAVVIFDLDYFKTINDSLGHEQGDQLLRGVAERLRQELPTIRCLARLGGDEFAAVIGNLGSDFADAEHKAMLVAETISAKLREPFSVSGQSINVGVSVGVSVFPQPFEQSASSEDAFRQADIALYRAKSGGRNRAALYASVMAAEANQRLQIEDGLRAALRRGEFELYFQPQVNVFNAPVGAEALLRWHHPTLGLVEPGRFIPVAEETGLIQDIGEFVLGRACAYLREWREWPFSTPARLSVNVSALQLAMPDFTQRVKNILLREQVDARQLTLEITESAVLQDTDRAIRVIRELRALGMRISIDDFGSGYSALGQLKKFHLDELKIDRVFVRDMKMDVRDEYIMTILAIAKESGLYVVAEGVETDVQRSALTLLGCSAFQGYLICHPQRAAGFISWHSHNVSVRSSRSRPPNPDGDPR